MPGAFGGAAGVPDLPEAFTSAMCDDFSVPQALAVLHGTVRAGNVALESGARDEVAARAREVAAMLDVLGIDPRDERWGGSAAVSDAGGAALDLLVQSLIEQRAKARVDRDFALGDEIRDRLQAVGIALEDTPNGTRWSQL